MVGNVILSKQQNERIFILHAPEPSPRELCAETEADVGTEEGVPGRGKAKAGSAYGPRPAPPPRRGHLQLGLTVTLTDLTATFIYSPEQSFIHSKNPLHS